MTAVVDVSKGQTDKYSFRVVGTVYMFTIPAASAMADPTIADTFLRLMSLILLYQHGVFVAMKWE